MYSVNATEVLMPAVFKAPPPALTARFGAEAENAIEALSQTQKTVVLLKLSGGSPFAGGVTKSSRDFLFYFQLPCFSQLSWSHMAPLLSLSDA